MASWPRAVQSGLAWGFTELPDVRGTSAAERKFLSIGCLPAKLGRPIVS